MLLFFHGMCGTCVTSSYSVPVVEHMASCTYVQFKTCPSTVDGLSLPSLPYDGILYLPAFSKAELTL